MTIRLFEVGPSVKSTQVLGTSNDKRMDVTEGVCRLMLEQWICDVWIFSKKELIQASFNIFLSFHITQINKLKKA